MGTTNSNNLNINLPEHNAVLRLEVELRDKHARRPRQKPGYMANRDAGGAFGSPHNLSTATAAHVQNLNNYFVPLEKVSESRKKRIKKEQILTHKRKTRNHDGGAKGKAEGTKNERGEQIR